MNEENAGNEAPLIDLLVRVPEDARLIYQHDEFSYSSIPVGNYCQRALGRILQLQAEVESLKSAEIDNDWQIWFARHVGKFLLLVAALAFLWLVTR